MSSVGAVIENAIFGSPVPGRDSASRWRIVASLLGAMFLGLVVRVLFSPVFTGSDDVVYAHRGLEIANGIWRPTDYYGELRYGINLPIAFFIELFGANHIGYIGWSLFCSVLELGLVFLAARYFWGLRTALVVGVLIALTPLHVGLGARALSDAPLALFVTLAMLSFFCAEQTQNYKWLYVVAGASIGIGWWIKPLAAAPFACTFVLYALIWRKWRSDWLLAVLGGAAMVGLEFALFWAKFGDPLYAIKANFSGVNRYFVNNDAPWGDHNPWFYFDQMFHDGRDMWIVPYLAVAGLSVFLYKRRTAPGEHGWTAYVCFWALALLGIFSFFIYTLHPIKFIPKQQNYAVIFFAPLALLAGYGVARLKDLWLAGVMAFFAVGALLLSGIWLQHDQLHYAAIDKSVQRAEKYQGATVFVSEQALYSARLRFLAEHHTALAQDLRSLDTLGVTDLSELAQSGKALYTIIDPATPELAAKSRAAPIEAKLAKCWSTVDTFDAEANGVGQLVTDFFKWLRPKLPGFIDRRISFTDALMYQAPVRVMHFASPC